MSNKDKVYVILSKISIKTFNRNYGIVCSGLKNTANNNFKNYVSISHELKYRTILNQ
jgi:hypothetical protein